MYDDGGRAAAQEMRMLKVWSRSAFIAGRMLGMRNKTDETKAAAEFEEWWAKREKEE
jgi:hypothetical protein